MTEELNQNNNQKNMELSIPLKEWFHKELDGMGELQRRILENSSPDGWMFWNILYNLQLRCFTMDVSRQIAFEDEMAFMREQLKKDMLPWIDSNHGAVLGERDRFRKGGNPVARYGYHNMKLHYEAEQK